ncbi:Fic family protein [Desulfobacterales bacterium HSG17]|nr:Fic family protein [Desulfobacterales bacterium HSG17]
MDCLKASTIILFNRKAIEKHGGYGGGARDRRDLNQLADSILMAAEISEPKKDYIECICLAVYQIVKNHLFWDGNKRTAQYLINHCLKKHGIFYTGRPKDLALRIEALAASDATMKDENVLQLAYFIKSHLQTR